MANYGGQNPTNRGFHPADYAIFAAVLTVSLAIGLYHACTGGKQRTTKEYLMANRQMKTLPVALSILVSFVSGILVLGTPAEMYTRGTQLFMRTVGYCIACVLSSLLFVPLFFSLKVTSSFEYLEARFNSRFVKLIGTISMLIGNLFYMGLVMYTPATALEAATGFTLWYTIVASGILATVYTTLGGLKAVIWTDVFQAVVMVAGMVVIVIQGVLHVGGFSRMWNLNEEGGRLIFFDFNPDPTQRLSFWSTVVGGTFSTLAIFGIGQTSVQRYCTLPTLAQAKRAVYLNVPFLIIMNVLASLVGLVIYAYYSDIKCDPLKSKAIGNANQLVPYYVVDVINFPGVPGAFLAVLFSGALSSLSSCLNSAAAVTWQDIVRYFCINKSELRQAQITKLLVLIYGALAISMAFLARTLGGHVLQASLSFTGATMGPSLGMFLLGALFPFANAKGAAGGCILATAFCLWLSIGAFIVRPHPYKLTTSIEGCNSSSSSSSFFSLYNDSAPFGLGRYDENFSLPSTNGEFSSFAEFESSVLTEFPTSAINGFAASGISKLYEISFLWYSAIGCIMTILIGVCISLLTRSKDAKEPDARLLIPLFYRLFCCLPKKVRKKLLRDTTKEINKTTTAINDEKEEKACNVADENVWMVNNNDDSRQRIQKDSPGNEKRDSADSTNTSVTITSTL